MSNPERAPARRHGDCAVRLLLRGGICLGVLVAVLQAVLIGPILPDPMVLSAAGLADAHGPTFLAIHVIVVASSAAVFVGLPLVLRLAARWRSDGADDPEQATRFGDFESWTLLFGLVTTTFTIAVVHFVVIASLARAAHLDRSLALLVATYLIFAATWTVQVVRRFRRQPEPAPSAA